MSLERWGKCPGQRSSMCKVYYGELQVTKIVRKTFGEFQVLSCL
jgi:hypothetical protein